MAAAAELRAKLKFEDGRFMNRPYKVTNRAVPNGVTITTRVRHEMAAATGCTEI